MNPLNLVSRLVGNSILAFFGWNVELDTSAVLSNDNDVNVFAHTSNFDLLIASIYFLTIPEKIPHIYILMKPQVFEYKLLNWILSRLNCIKCVKMEEKGSGFTQQIIDYLKGKHFKLLIAPKGTMSRNENWRTGFYNIAKELNANVVAYSLNYETKELRLINKYNPCEYTCEELVNTLKYEFSKIPQINREYEVGAENHRRIPYIHLLPFDPVIVSNNIMILSSLYMSRDMPALFTVISIASLVSFIYHTSKESMWVHVDAICNHISIILMFIITLPMFRMDLIELFLMLSLLSFYSLGYGRHQHGCRVPAYTIFHSLFHLMFPLILFKIRSN